MTDQTELAMFLTTTIRPTFPLGPRTAWTAPSGKRFSATLLDGANRYVIVDRDPDGAEQDDADLEALRRGLAEAANWTVTANEPKLGCVAAGDRRRPLRFRVRQNPEQGWHPAMAASGVLALAAAAATTGTVPASLLGAPAQGSVRVHTPGGERTFVVHGGPDGLLVEYPLSAVSWVFSPAADDPAALSVSRSTHPD